MSPLASSRLQSLAPFWGDLDREAVPVRTLRLALVLVAVLNPVYGWVYGVASPEATDPWAVRWALTAASVAGLVATYRSRRVRERARALLNGVVYGALVWYGALAAANGLAPDYAVGYLVVVLAAAMVTSFVWDAPGALARVLGVGFGTGVVVAVAASPPDAELHPAVFLTALLSGSAVVFSALQGRVQAARALASSEARLAEAERLAATGAWTLDLATGRRTWSDGAYDLLRLDRALAPVSLLDLIAPDEVDACRAELDRLLAEGGASDLRFRVRRADGATRWLHSIAEVEHGRGGRAVRLRGVFQDVSDQVAREEALARARDRAEQADRAKSEFLANMSHEIRTPLTAIIGFAQLLRDEVGPEQAEMAEPIEAAGRRLLGTLNSVLDLARMEAGEADLALVPTDLAAEAAEVVALFRPLAEAKGLPLLYAGPDGAVPALTDPDAFGRVLTNLLSNAVKFTARGHVAVRVAAEGGRAVVEVADTGRGMDPAFLDDLFEPFRQASTGWARSHEGTGLGMTITRRLVDAMGGRVGVESAPGEGSRFTVAFPLAAPAAEPRADARPAVSARAPAAA